MQVWSRCSSNARARIEELNRIRVLLADDHEDLLRTVESMLVSEFEVVGTVKDGQALLDAADQLKPDVLVVDISMPIMNGIEAVQQLKESGFQTQVVFLTVHEDTAYVRAALATGARGYIVKPRLASDLSVAIKEAHAGRLYLSPSISLQN